MTSPNPRQQNSQVQPRQTAARTARVARTCLLLVGIAILAWTAIGSYQLAATYGAWGEHAIFVGGVGALLSTAVLLTGHRIAAWRHPTRAVSIAILLIAVAVATVSGTLTGARTLEQDTRPAASGWKGESGAWL